MLLAIDVGNTHTVYGLHDGVKWLANWRRRTNLDDTEDEIAAWLLALFNAVEEDVTVDAVICACVVPPLDFVLEKLASKWFSLDIKFLRTGEQVGLEVRYDPKTSVGADRIANALAGLERYKPPFIIVDFGTATTLDCIGATGDYLGGAIIPGVLLGAQSLQSRTAKLPLLAFEVPKVAVGRNTMESLQSGLILGYAFAIDGLVKAMEAEMGALTTVVATGGLGSVFVEVCKNVHEFEPMLTLEGLTIAHRKLSR